MDGRGHWLDNVFIERLWRWLKYECCIRIHWRPAQKPARAPGNGSIFTTGADPTVAEAACPQTAVTNKTV